MELRSEPRTSATEVRELFDEDEPLAPTLKRDPDAEEEDLEDDDDLEDDEDEDLEGDLDEDDEDFLDDEDEE